MLTKCVNCDFNIRKTENFCPNCGLEEPTKEFSELPKYVFPLLKISESNFLRLLFTLIFTFFLLFVIADFDVSGILYLRDYILILSVLSGFGFYFFTFSLLRKWCVKKLNPKRRKNAENFSSQIKIVKKRISELDNRVTAIDKILDTINRNSSSQLQEVRKRLIPAREIVIGQMARYELQENKINLARLQNSVAPFVFGIHRLNETETENGLTAIENTKNEVEKMRQNLTNDYARDFPKAVEFEKESFLKQIEETEISCAKVREAILSRQATRALEGISPIEENLKMPNSKEISRAVETFNIETTLTDFSESFEELEREYKRLKSEDEVSRNLLNE